MNDDPIAFRLRVEDAGHGHTQRHAFRNHRDHGRMMAPGVKHHAQQLRRTGDLDWFDEKIQRLHAVSVNRIVAAIGNEGERQFRVPSPQLPRHGQAAQLLAVLVNAQYHQIGAMFRDRLHEFSRTRMHGNRKSYGPTERRMPECIGEMPGIRTVFLIYVDSQNIHNFQRTYWRVTAHSQNRTFATK
ncbi:hypothetical protein JS532_05585 [Bifidobacterium callimiconis]|uniref:hypothetical protein n=1 Tax=Bifidobacterium callimiconis TaxID=2306973 RepID=UPI001BDBF935|nr:hypothetical protein [Bifidobacterium callimiconis]